MAIVYSVLGLNFEGLDFVDFCPQNPDCSEVTILSLPHMVPAGQECLIRPSDEPGHCNIFVRILSLDTAKAALAELNKVSAEQIRIIEDQLFSW